MCSGLHTNSLHAEMGTMYMYSHIFINFSKINGMDIIILVTVYQEFGGLLILA